MAVKQVIKTFKAIRATTALRLCGNSVYQLTKDAEMTIFFDVRSGALAPNPERVRIIKNRGREISGTPVLYDELNFDDWEEIHRFGGTDNLRKSTEELLKIQESLHRKKAEELQTISEDIKNILWSHYTESVILQFKKFDYFLSDVNHICKSESYGKLIFINQIKNKYYDSEKNLRTELISKNSL